MDYKTGLSIQTFEAKVIIGKNVGYTAEVLDYQTIKNAIKQASENVGNFVFSGTITPTEILVTGNNKNYEEQGFKIETSIYPRFPVEIKKFKDDFVKFVDNLLVLLKQERTGIRFSDESLMIETKYCKNPDLK
ncbi:MAG: hypothetical protein AAB778_01420 [Patescibacteria group bacterium]